MADSTAVVIETDAFDFSEDSTHLTFAELYKQLTVHESVIIEIDNNDLRKIQKGLSNIKYRENQKIRELGLDSTLKELQFVILPKEMTDFVGRCRLQISLIDTVNAVKIHSIVPADKEI